MEQRGVTIQSGEDVLRFPEVALLRVRRPDLEEHLKLLNSYIAEQVDGDVTAHWRPDLNELNYSYKDLTIVSTYPASRILLGEYSAEGESAEKEIARLKALVEEAQTDLALISADISHPYHAAQVQRAKTYLAYVRQQFADAQNKQADARKTATRLRALLRHLLVVEYNYRPAS